MVPVVAPAVLEYADPLWGLGWNGWCWWLRAGVGTLLGPGTAGTLALGLGLLFLVSVPCEAGLEGWWMRCGLLFENCIVDASILFFVAASLIALFPPGVVCEVW